MSAVGTAALSICSTENGQNAYHKYLSRDVFPSYYVVGSCCVNMNLISTYMRMSLFHIDLSFHAGLCKCGWLIGIPLVACNNAQHIA